MINLVFSSSFKSFSGVFFSFFSFLLIKLVLENRVTELLFLIGDRETETLNTPQN